MDRDVLARNERATRAAFAVGLGCPVDAFSSETLTIVDRPARSLYPHVCTATTFGTGTVLSVDPAYRAFIEANAPAVHYRAMYAVLLQAVVDEGAQRGQTLEYQTPNVGFTLGSAPPERAVPQGFALREVDVAWMAAERPNKRFHNACDDHEGTNRFAIVLFDPDGEPVAAAGVSATYGLFEIGLDVVRERRGQALAPIVVSAAANEIVARGEVPFYTCGATNIRSHRTAEASGFAAVMSAAVVTPARAES